MHFPQLFAPVYSPANIITRTVKSALALAVCASSLLAQKTDTMTWTGTFRTGQESRALQYRIPNRLDTREFQVSGLERGREPVAVRGIRFEGIKLQFQIAMTTEVECSLTAIPAAGYKGNCVGQNGDSMEITLVPPAPGMLLPDHEVLIARDAALPAVAADASVFVMGPSGYWQAVRGSNGYTCFIKRPRVIDLWPVCHSSTTAEPLLDADRLRLRMRLAGIGDAAVADSVQAAYQTGRLPVPTSGAMSYMLSRYAWTTLDTGAQAFLGPHVHFYKPGLTNALLGIDFTKGRPPIPLRVEQEGLPDASVIVGIAVRASPSASPGHDHP